MHPEVPSTAFLSLWPKSRMVSGLSSRRREVGAAGGADEQEPVREPVPGLGVAHARVKARGPRSAPGRRDTHRLIVVAALLADHVPELSSDRRAPQFASVATSSRRAANTPTTFTALRAARSPPPARRHGRDGPTAVAPWIRASANALEVKRRAGIRARPTFTLGRYGACSSTTAWRIVWSPCTARKSRSGWRDQDVVAVTPW